MYFYINIAYAGRQAFVLFLFSKEISIFFLFLEHLSIFTVTFGLTLCNMIFLNYSFAGWLWEGSWEAYLEYKNSIYIKIYEEFTIFSYFLGKIPIFLLFLGP